MASTPLGITQLLDWPQVFRARWVQLPFTNRSFSPPPPNPFSLSDFPPSWRAKWAPIEVIPQLSPPLNAGLLQPTPPYNQTDWFNIYRPRWAPMPEPSASKLITGYPVPVAPVSETDWFTVFRPRWIPAEPVPQNSLLTGIPSPVPFNQTDWHFGRIGRWVPAEPVSQNYLLQGIPRPFPFQQTDWFAPYRYRWSVIESTFPNQVVYGFPNVGNPFAQTDWPQILRPAFLNSSSVNDAPNQPIFASQVNLPAGPFSSSLNTSPVRAKWSSFDLPQNVTLRLPLITKPPNSLTDWTAAPKARWWFTPEVYPNTIFSGLTNPILRRSPAEIVNQIRRPGYINDTLVDIGQNSLTLNAYNPIFAGVKPPSFGQVYKPFKVADYSDISQNSLVLGAPIVPNPFIPYPDFSNSVQFRSKFISETWVVPNNLAPTTFQIPPFGPFDYSQIFWNNWEGDKTTQNLNPNLYSVQPIPFTLSDWQFTSRGKWVEKDDSDFPNLILGTNFPAPFSWDDSCWPSVQRPRWVQSIDFPPSETLLFFVPVAPFNLLDWTPAQRWRPVPLQLSDIFQSFVALTTAQTKPFGLSDFPTLPTFRSAQQAPVILNPIIYGIPSGPAPFFYGIDFYNYPKSFKFTPSVDTLLPFSFLNAIGVIGGGPGPAIITLARRRRPYTTRNQRLARKKYLDEWAQGIRDIPQDYRS